MRKGWTRGTHLFIMKERLDYRYGRNGVNEENYVSSRTSYNIGK